MFKSILVATDGSGYSNRAVATACDLAAKLDVPLTMVHVLGHGHLSPDMAKMLEVEHLVERERFRSPRVEEVSGNIGLAMREDTVTYEFRARRVVGEQIVKRARTAARDAGARVAGAFVDDGEPVDRIIERARESEADLIVLGRRGLSDLHGLLVGSVTHKVSQLADCACLTVK
ncbi:MAG: universal stress protein [Gammaproteobacteria bacterium]|nr:universal stress protein [Gammaproteobacteria bacterium]